MLGRRLNGGMVQERWVLQEKKGTGGCEEGREKAEKRSVAGDLPGPCEAPRATENECSSKSCAHKVRPGDSATVSSQQHIQ